MTNKHGDFIWYELLTPDADAAGRFYGAVIGWTSVQLVPDNPGADYRIFSSSDGRDTRDNLGGCMEMSADMAAGGARPAWVGYITVDDVDKGVDAVLAAGGRVLMPAMDVEMAGRMAMVTDPQGAPFYLMKGASEGTSHSFAAYEAKVGHCAWNELASSDPEGAKSFYQTLFGWRKTDENDMVDMGQYEILSASENRFTIGAVYPKVEEDEVSHWLFYFRVANLTAAIEALHTQGGHLRADPVAVPDRDDWTVQACDPDGAWFGMIGPR
jgi:uncharacterized protein